MLIAASTPDNNDDYPSSRSSLQLSLDYSFVMALDGCKHTPHGHIVQATALVCEEGGGSGERCEEGGGSGDGEV